MELGQGPPVGAAARAAVCEVQNVVSVELCMAWPDGVGLMAGSIIRAPEARARKRPTNIQDPVLSRANRAWNGAFPPWVLAVCTSFTSHGQGI